MKRAVSFLNENRFTAGMLLFIALFYAISFFGEPRNPVGVENASPTEFKEKEALFEKNIAKQPGLITAISAAFLSLLLAGILIDVRILSSWRRRGRWLDVSLPQEAVGWDGTHVFQAVVFMFFVEAILLILEALFYFRTGSGGWSRDLVLMANSLVRSTLTAIFIMILVMRRGHKLRDLGLAAKDLFKNIGRGLLAYIAAFPALLLTLLVLAFAAKAISYEPVPQNVVQIYLKSSSDPYLLFFTLFVAGAGPILEEIFFRGFTYKAFRQKLGVVPAMAVSSLIFALFHLNLAAFIPVFLLGMLLCYLYEVTGSLVAPMTTHAAHNFFMISLTLGVKSIIAQ